MACAMKRQTALLFSGLARYEAHVSRGDGFANRFRISRIALMSFDVRLDVAGGIRRTA